MTILLADAGGTHIRFSVSVNGRDLAEPQKLKVADYPRLEDAIEHYLFSQRIEADDIKSFYYAYGGRNAWSTAGLKTCLPNAAVRVVNDFEANSYGVIAGAGDEFHTLVPGSGQAASIDSSRAVIGSGTGLGLAYIVSSRHGNIVQRTHGGHMLPVTVSEEHRAVFAAVQALKTTPTAPIYEDVLGGPGLFNVYGVLARQAHLDKEYRDTNDMIARGHNDPVAKQALRLYHEILGVFAHQVLAFGHSYRGLYLTGGVTDRLVGHNQFDTATFCKFLYQENVSIVRQDVAATPIFWIKDEFISLKGLLCLAQQDAT